MLFLILHFELGNSKAQISPMSKLSAESKISEVCLLH